MSGKLSCQGGGNGRSRAQDQHSWHACTSSGNDGHGWSDKSLAQGINTFVFGEEKIHHRAHRGHGEESLDIPP
jgi:hypothetical protein